MELSTPISNKYSIKDNLRENVKTRNAYLNSRRLFVKPSRGSYSVSLASNEVIANLSPAKLIESFQSSDVQQIRAFCSLLVESVSKIPVIASNIMENEDALTCLVDALSSEIDVETLVIIVEAVGMLATFSDATPLVNSGVIFSALALIDTQPLIALQLVTVLAKKCSYAADGLISYGFIQTIIDTIKATESVEIAVACSEAFVAIAIHVNQMGRECCDPLITDLLPLLQVPQPNVVSNVLMAISYLVDNCAQCAVTLYTHNVQGILLEMISNEEVVSAALSLTETMVKTESEHLIQELISCGLLVSIVSMLPESPHAAKIYRILTSAFQSAPDVMTDIISLDFLSVVAAMSADCDIDVYRELANFSAVVVLYSQSDVLADIIGTGIANSLVEMLECGVNGIVMHCLQAINRVLVLCESDLQLSHVAGIFLDSAEHVEILENLVESEDKFISATAQLVLNELEKNSVEQL